MQDQFIVFEEYAKTVKEALENILHDYNMGEKDKVQIIYATPPVAFASFSQHQPSFPSLPPSYNIMLFLFIGIIVFLF